tara:strand:+ start:2148 stop:2342 length:195 start_codon:yes stop_codon:yes gene_type:complete
MWVFLIIYMIFLMGFFSLVENIGGGLGAFIGIVGAIIINYLWYKGGLYGGGGGDENPRDSDSQW